MANKDFDFGFSIIDESTLKVYEKQLEIKLSQTEEDKAIIALESLDAQEKIEELRRMIMTLLENLMQEPDKAYIWWPNRQEKVKQFIDKINKVVDG